jgi:outer membrane protein OmpU
MNNFKKIGISALAGSLAMVSAHAVDYTMSGEIASTFSTQDSPTSTEALNGKGFGTETDLTFTAAGELDNGFTVDMLMGVDTATALTNTSSQVTVGMGSLGTIRLNHIGGSSANAIDDVMPAAYQETWDGLSDGTNPSFFGSLTASGSIEYRIPAQEYMGVTFNASLLYDPGSSEASNAPRGVGATSVSGTAYTVKLNHDSGLELGGGYETVEDDGGQAGVMGNTTNSTAYAKFSMGPLSVGVQEAWNNAMHSDSVRGGDSSATFMGVAYTAGDVTVSYGESTLQVEAIGTTASTEEELDSVQVAYTMGAMTISGAMSETDNLGGTAGATFEENTLAVSFAF